MVNKEIGSRLSMSDTNDWINKLGKANRSDLCKNDQYPGLKLAKSLFSRIFSKGQFKFETDYIDKNNNNLNNAIVKIKIGSLAKLYGVKRGQFSNFKKLIKNIRKELKTEDHPKPKLEDCLNELNTRIINGDKKITKMFSSKTIDIFKNEDVNLSLIVVDRKEVNITLSSDENSSRINTIYTDSTSDYFSAVSQSESSSLSEVSKVTKRDSRLENYNEIERSSESIYEDSIGRTFEESIFNIFAQEPSINNVVFNDEDLSNSPLATAFQRIDQVMRTWDTQLQVSIKNKDMNTAKLTMTKMALVKVSHIKAIETCLGLEDPKPQDYLENFKDTIKNSKLDDEIISTYEKFNEKYSTGSDGVSHQNTCLNCLAIITSNNEVSQYFDDLALDSEISNSILTQENLEFALDTMYDAWNFTTEIGTAIYNFATDEQTISAIQTAGNTAWWFGCKTGEALCFTVWVTGKVLKATYETGLLVYETVQEQRAYQGTLKGPELQAIEYNTGPTVVEVLSSSIESNTSYTESTSDSFDSDKFEESITY